MPYVRKWKRFNVLQMVVPKVLRTEILNRLHDAEYAGKDLRQSKGWVLLAMHDKRCFSLVSNLHFMSRRKPDPGLGKSPMQREPVNRPLECIR